jgi:hypothetical protein
VKNRRIKKILYRKDLVNCDCGGTGLTGANPDGFLHCGDEDLSVTDLASVGALHDGGGDARGLGIINNDFNLHLGKEIHGIFRSTIDFGVALLAAEALNFCYGHSLNSHFGKGFFHFFEFERLDDRFDFFHGSGGLVWDIEQNPCQVAPGFVHYPGKA